MKVKALLFALAAMVGMTAAAGTPPTTTKFYANDVTLEDASAKAIIGIVVENPEQPDLTFFQFAITAPEGFQFVQLSEQEAGVSNKTKMKDAIVAGIALENDDHDDFAATCSLENGTFVLGSMGNEPLGVNDGSPIMFIAAQATSKALAGGDYEFTINNIVISGANTDQSLYGALPDATFKVTVPGTSTAVTDINAKAVAGVKYYNLAGVESDMPFDGVNVVVTTYTDGTKAASKVIK